MYFITFIDGFTQYNLNPALESSQPINFLVILHCGIRCAVVEKILMF